MCNHARWEGGPIVDTNRTDRSAVNLSGFQIENRLGHAFRPQDTSDYGVDAHVEIMRADVATGRLVGLQIKGGPSYFKEETADGWRYRPSRRHVTYWLGHSLPMFLLLVDLATETVYWQEVSERTLETGPKGGLFVLIPRAQTLSTAGAAWETAADRFANIAAEQYEDNLERLPPHVARKLQAMTPELRGPVALLAAHLAHGRGAPEVVIRTLLGSDPTWLAALGPSAGLVTIADYAHAHDLSDLAAEALLRAAERDPDDAFRYTKHAGLMLLGSDRSRARELLNSAATMQGADGDARLAVGFAILEHPVGSASPIALSPAVETILQAANNDDLVLTFLARRKEFGHDLDEAARLAEAALRVVPDSAGVMELLAQILTRRARSTASQPGDHSRALRLASEAIDQFHRWSGPTESALGTLLQCQMTAGDFAGALNRSLPAPEGRATPEESQRPEVQAVAAIASTALDKPDITTRIIEAMPDGIDKKIAVVRLDRTERPDDEKRTQLLGLFPELDDERPEALLQIVMRLSDLGVDESARLDTMVARSMITSGLQRVVAVTAAAALDLNANLPALRALADTEEIAAAKLIDLLADAQRADEAQDAASTAYTRYGTADFAARRCELLRFLQRGDEAATVANDVLASSGVDPLNRRIAHRILARYSIDTAATTQGDASKSHLQRAERQFLECVNADDGLAVDERDVWQLAEVQLQLGSADRAYATITTHDPQVSNDTEARLWLAVVMQQHSLPQSIYLRMLDLADQYAGDATLSAAFLTAVITRTRDASDEPATPADSRPAVDGNLRAAAFAALQTHVQRHGADSPIQVIEAPTPEGLIKKMTEIMRRDDAPLTDVLEMIRQARLPLGFLATATNRPYSAMLALRPLGYYLASPAIEDEDTLDDEAARGAFGSDVVVDPSALLVATELGEYQQVRGNFRNILMARVTHDDIVRGRFDLDGRSASSGFVAYDPATDSIGAGEIDINEHLAALGRFLGLERSASQVQILPTVAVETLNGIDLPEASTWLGPIALAKDRGIALWSDDVAQRRLARALEVAAFSTLTLQQIRATDALGAEDLSTEAFDQIVAGRRSESLAALAARIADIPIDVSTVVEQARAEGWDQAVALVTVGRPGWWHLAVNPWSDLQNILKAAEADSANADPWRYHAMWGVARLAADEPSRVATLLAAMALLQPGGGPDEDEAVRHLKAAHQIATLRKVHRPVDYLAEAATTLVTAGCLADVSDWLLRVRSRFASDE